jgi:hypothetical protein
MISLVLPVVILSICRLRMPPAAATTTLRLYVRAYIRTDVHTQSVRACVRTYAPGCRHPPQQQLHLLELVSFFIGISHQTARKFSVQVAVLFTVHSRYCNTVTLNVNNHHRDIKPV